MSIYSLSDAMIIAVPLADSPDEHCAIVTGIYHTLVTVCKVGLKSLSKCTPVRAGIAVGLGTNIDGKEICGPVLNKAYYLETELAEYPRFLVEYELIDYLSWVENQNITTSRGKVATYVAKYCKLMLMPDTDGWFMLDYLGGKCKDAYEDCINKEDVVSAFNFVDEQLEKYSKDNDKLYSRYFRLFNYFKHRKSIWGIN